MSSHRAHSITADTHAATATTGLPATALVGPCHSSTTHLVLHMFCLHCVTQKGDSFRCAFIIVSSFKRVSLLVKY